MLSAGTLTLLALTATLTGCGLSPGRVPTDVSLTITTGFGARTVHRSSLTKIPSGETVIGLLRRSGPITGGTRGQPLSDIDGVAATQEQHWSYYINGVRATQNPARTIVHQGDRVWWDLHDSSTAAQAPAVVGSFPEPFLNGIEGKRLPVRVQCASVQGRACKTITDRLRALEVPAAVAGLGVTEGFDTLRVLVGDWRALEGDPAAQNVDSGPETSGVYAGFSPAGATLTLLDEHLRASRTLRGAAGLIAAARFSNESPEWLITGTDDRGVELAADAFTEAALLDRYAVAVTGTETIAIPARPG